MKRFLAGAFALGFVGSAAGLGTASAEETTFAVGGAKPPGVPWQDFTAHVGQGYYPNFSRAVVDYPGGVFDQLLPPGVPGVGPSVVIGQGNLDSMIREASGGPNVAVALSEGGLVLDAEQAHLVNDPTAPPRDQLAFTTFGSPVGTHAFGGSFLSTMFPPGTYLPVIEYTVPGPVESQYDTNRVVAAYDLFADFPDRPNLVSFVNSILGAGFYHTPAAFSNPADVPPQNVRATTNSRGGTTTTYLVPNQHLPLTLPLSYLGVNPGTIASLDAILKPMVDAGYSRNDNPFTAPTTVSPAGRDPLELLGQALPEVAQITGLVNQARAALPPALP